MNSGSSSVEFWQQKKKTNWFCNRGLSPQPPISTMDEIKEIKYEDDTFLSSSEDPFSQSYTEDYWPSSYEESSSLDRQIFHQVKKHKLDEEFEEKTMMENQYESKVHSHSPIEVETTDIHVPNKPESIQNYNNGHNQILSQTTARYQRKPDFCYFCETPVLNFARHLKRNNSAETEVAQILSKPPNCKERRRLLNILRRKGNFIGSTDGKCFKAVRLPELPKRSLLPCDKCLGFFSSKLLYRHRIKCHNEKPEGSAQSAGHTLLIKSTTVNKRLKDEVFPHMRVDRVSLEAKQDTLICAFGSRYLNAHREKHFIQVTSRKMRELAKVLIEMKKIEPSIENLFSALQPKNFDYFVEATKRLAKYNAEDDTYDSPTFAMNIATSLKQCCDIAITYAYKKHGPYMNIESGNLESSLKTLIHLFESNWKFEISSQAANCLSLNKWNKITVVPLASDLKLLRSYLIELAENNAKKLSETKTLDGLDVVKSYNNLMESVYCRVILLNRKRSGELQRMLLSTYQNNSANNQEYEEFKKIISPTERILLNKMKRIVIRGKRGRGVPVLFSADVQSHIDILIQVRDSFVPSENIYLFAKANSISNIIGHQILSKNAKNCGAKNPSAITSTRLRKHLATLSQLFSLSENEIEQLSTFMGHTTGVHRNNYRLPDDVYQTSKISKLLLIMENGCADKFKGKSLDEIDINMEENLLRGDDKSDESEFETEDRCAGFDNSIVSTSTDVKNLTKIVKNRVLVPWTNEQKNTVKSFFHKHLEECRPPKKSECEELKMNYPELFANKDWTKMKVFVQNEYKKNKIVSR